MMNMVKKNNKVLLGLSGGVDSTAAALLLKEKGYEVTGYYFDVHGDNNNGREEPEKRREPRNRLDMRRRLERFFRYSYR